MTNHVGAIAIDRHHEETNERQNERGVGGREGLKDGTLVNDHRLQWWQHISASDGHDQTSGTKLRIIAHTIKGDTINGGEHQRHTTTDTHQRIET